MLKRNILIGTGFIFSFIVSVVDFFAFAINPKLFFILHNLFAFTIGLILIFVSKNLLLKKSGKIYINYLILFSGLAMAIIHAAKLFIGKCI